jgi:hypothetical protein
LVILMSALSELVRSLGGPLVSVARE